MSGCTYSAEDLSPPEHSAEKVTIPTDWSCNHTAVDGDDRCLFHIPPDARSELDISEAEVTKAAHELVTSTTEEADLTGAILPELDVQDTVVTGSSGDILYLRCATISGELNFSDTRIELPVKAEGVEIGDGIEIDNTVFDNQVQFYGARIKGTVEGRSVHFRDKATFARVLASYSIYLHDSTVFEKTATFSNLTIKGTTGTLQLRRISANAPFYCRQIEVPALDCSEAIFQGLVGFSGATINGTADFSNAHFNALAAFGDGDRKQFDNHTRIEGQADFSSVLADQTLSFEKVQFHGGLNLSDGSFSRGVELPLVTLYSELILNNASFADSLVFKPQFTTTAGDSEYFLVEATGTAIADGTLAQPGQTSSDPVRYEFVNAKIGDVAFLDSDLDGEPFIQSNYSYYTATLNHVKFIRTRFEGFDFTSYRAELDGDWNLHQFTDEGTTEDTSPSVKDLELTYMYGKQGASHIGDNLSESKLFEREMAYRTQRYHPNQTNAGEGNWWKYSSLRLWGITDYSESPLRVFGLGLLLTIGFAFLYGLFAFLGLSQAPYPDTPAGVGYLLFSAESLITLVHAPGATVNSWLLRSLSVAEGFLGAFLIALFVFSLTRAVHR